MALICLPVINFMARSSGSFLYVAQLVDRWSCIVGRQASSSWRPVSGALGNGLVLRLLMVTSWPGHSTAHCPAAHCAAGQLQNAIKLSQCVYPKDADTGSEHATVGAGCHVPCIAVAGVGAHNGSLSGLCAQACGPRELRSSLPNRHMPCASTVPVF